MHTAPDHGRYVLGFHQTGQLQIALLGGKAANLGEVSRIEGIRVPSGFCVITTAFQRMMSDVPRIVDRLEQLRTSDVGMVTAIAAEIRRTIEDTPIPDDVAAAITDAIAARDGETSFAVRSSATAEDLPAASFAGQHDSYLNIVGADAVLRHVRRCWGSLFTERAVIYRRRNAVDDRKVRMAVIVQEMVKSRAAGVLFTADPVTSNRKLSAIEAIPGCGEALASGLVTPDTYTVRAGNVTATAIAGDHRVLTDSQLAQLEQLGRRIESRFGCPQDIEWCLDDDGFQIVQSRPITTLFPVPAANDNQNHVYVSVGHQQMMTDAMKPLGISVWQLTAGRPMVTAGGRLFVDVTRELGSPASRSAVIAALGRSDPLISDALQTIVDRGDFVPARTDDDPAPAGAYARAPDAADADPAIVAELMACSQASIATAKRDIGSHSGPGLFDFILADLQELKRVLFVPQNMQAIRAGMEASRWLNDNLQTWLGETSAADMLTQSAPNNVTSEMGLALLEVADVIRPHRQVVEFLQHADDANFLATLPTLPGGREVKDAVSNYLEKYGMRCAGEIDITRPRWSERPATLVPLILDHIRNFEPGAGKRRFDHGAQRAREKERELLARLRALPDGEQKAAETKRMIGQVRAFAGYREYPKYAMISRYFLYKQALLKEAARLVHSQVLRENEDIFFLTFDELHQVVRTQQADGELIRQRKDAFRSYQSLMPPRVLTSDGETVAGKYRRDDVPPGALAGLAVSAGTVEGRARVIVEIANADLEPGDILVTTYTDPSWTPLFVAIAGVVTEVGGLMTHGAVIAREYGVPAVVGVEHATQLIQDGERIRVNGLQGYVEILSAV